ncbi:MAG: tetratricopeptide repeat protein [Candidatus Korobacteraceae bacterium]
MTSAVSATTMGSQSRLGQGWLGWIETRTWVLSALLVVATLALYYPVHHHPFVNYDDSVYVTENPRVQSGLDWDTVKWAFTTYDAGNWHPLTWLSHTLDYELFELNPAGHHDVNLLLHVLNVLLLFWVLKQATGFAGRSFMVAALFALHPINVQTVAWVAERKNLLSMLFFLLALGAYQWYVRQPRVGRYAVVALLFALGLMAKPQVITLPCVLLLWDYWPLRRMALSAPEHSSGEVPPMAPAKSFYSLLEEKFPLLAIAGVNAFITMQAQGRGGARNYFPRFIRLGNAIICYARYVGKAVWPSRLALFYPHPGYSLKVSHVVAALVFLLAVTALVAIQWRRRYLAVGWLWFVGTMVPMIGLIQVGVQAMADRYAYLPFVGLFIMICWGVTDWSEQRHISAAWLATVSIAVLVALTVTARVQLDYWADNVSLWSHTVQVTGPNFIAQNSLGIALQRAGREDDAIAHYRKAVAINPDDAASNLNLAEYDRRHGNLLACIERCKKIPAMTQLTVEKAAAYAKMALAYHALGDTAHERECLQEVQQIQRGQ